MQLRNYTLAQEIDFQIVVVKNNNLNKYSIVFSTKSVCKYYAKFIFI